MREDVTRSQARSTSSRSVARKLEIRPDCALYTFLERELAEQFDYACCDELEEFRRLPPAERERLVNNYRRYQTLPPERQNALRERYRGLTPEQRQSLRERRMRQPLPGQGGPGPGAGPR